MILEIESKDESLVDKAELILAVKDYEMDDIQQRDDGLDLIATLAKTDEKILMRVISEPKSKSGMVGVTAIREMRKTMNRLDADKGVLISKKFSVGAKDEMMKKGIQPVSENLMPPLKKKKLFTAISEYIDDLCQIKCDLIPEKESDCKGFSDGHYSCKIRQASDKATFYFEHGWTKMLQKVFEQLIALRHSLHVEPLNS